MAVTLLLSMMVTMMVATVSGNDELDNFSDSDEGSNDRMGIVNLRWWQ